MKKLNRTAKLAFYNARREKEDIHLISATVKRSTDSVGKMLSANRRINEEVADAAFMLSYNRERNSVVEKALGEIGLRFLIKVLAKNGGLDSKGRKIINKILSTKKN